MNTTNWIFKHPLVMYIVLSLVLFAPLLMPGFVFALDMVFGPKINLPTDITASYPFYLMLRFLNFILPTQVIQKLLLIGIILLCGIAAHRLTEYLLSKNKINTSHWPAYFAGVLYIMNPFTYTRFMDGQYSVLLGYALLPFFVKALFELLFDKRFTRVAALRLALYTLVISIVSIHAVGYLAVMTFAALSVFAWREKHDKSTLKHAAKYIGLTLAIALALSSYWTIPTLLNDTPREQLIENFDRRHLLSFRTDGANDLSVIGNALTMNGYWGDREERYILPRSAMPLWPLLFAGIFALASYGYYRARKDPKVQVLLISAAIATVLAIGIAAVPFSYVNEALFNHLPFFRGFREPQKFVSILVLFYAVAGGIGLSYLLDHKKVLKSSYRPWLISIAFALPLLYTPTFLWGFVGQLKSRNYPADWAYINKQYVKQAEGAVLFLPWHQYMYFDFADRAIVNPAPIYFDGKIIAGDNAEIGLIETQVDNPSSEAISSAIAEQTPAELDKALTLNNIQYVLLSKNVDWEDYAFLDRQPQLRLMTETETLKLYENTDFHKH